MTNSVKNPILQQGASAAEIAENLIKNTELNISGISFRAMLNSSLILEKFSTWLLAGIGATCALIIANINSMSKIIDISTIKYSLMLLVISGLFGFLSKYYSIQIQIVLEVDEILRNLLPKILETHIEEEKKVHNTAQEQNVTINTIPDIIGSMRKVADSAPWFKRKKTLKDFEKGKEDPLFGYRRAMRNLYFQTSVTILEFICFLLPPFLNL